MITWYVENTFVFAHAIDKSQLEFISNSLEREIKDKDLW
jgi:hypothetical protein